MKERGEREKEGDMMIVCWGQEEKEERIRRRKQQKKLRKWGN